MILNKQIVQDLFLKYSNFDKELILTLDYDGKELLKLEKKRKGFDENKLLFVSANNFSKLILNSNLAIENMKKNELEKFGAYMRDKIEYSLKLKKIKKFPKTNLDLLEIGNNLKIKDVLNLKKIKNKSINIEKDKLRIKIENNPLILGNIIERLYARKLDTIHFYKEYGGLIFTGEPDGISDNFVYEFKSHKNKYLAEKYLESAKLQADIYSLIFGINTKIVEQYIISWNKIRKFEFEFDIQKINKLIEKYF